MAEPKVYNGYTYTQQADGSWKRGAPVAPQMPADPTFPYQGPKAQAEVRKTQADAAITEAQLPYASGNAEAEAVKSRADADKARAEAEKARIEIERARFDMQQGKDPEAAVRAAKSILRILDRQGGLQEQYDENLSGWNPLEYLPTAKMRQFDADAGFIKPAAKKLFRAKGEGAQSDAENKDWENLIPSTWATDEKNSSILDNLRAEAIGTLQEYGQPIPTFKKDEERDPLTVGPGDGRKFSPAGGPQMQAAQGESYSTPEDLKVAAAIQEVYNRGGGVREMAEAAKKFGYPVDLQRASEWQQAVDYRDAKGKYAGMRTGFSTVTPPQSGQRSLASQAWGEFAAGPTGTALLSAADAGSFGLVDEAAGAVNSAVNGTDYEGERDYANFGKQASFAENPTAAAIGMIGGGVTGGFGIGKAGQAVGSRLTPEMLARANALLAGGKGAALEGAAYGTAYGAGSSNDNRLGGAAVGALGGGLGGGAGYLATKTLGGVVGGVGDAATQRLAERGVSMTPGQMLRNSGTLGRIVNRLEEGAESVPPFNALIRQRREDSFGDFNRAAFDEALAPIGEGVSNVAEQGVEDAFDAVNRGYGKALNGVNIPPDGQFADDLLRAGSGVSPDNPYYPDFQQIVSGEIRPTVAGKTALSGQDMQDLLRMSGSYSRSYRDLATKGTAEGPKPFARPIADAFDGMEGAIEGLVQRQSPGTLGSYNNAKEAFRRTGVIRDAVSRAKVGTASGEGGIFTPAQLALDATLNAKKFGGSQGTTRQPFYQLTRDGQEVLPSTLPNSGTYDRAVSNAMLGAPVIGAGVAASQGWIDPETAAAIAAASGLYSRTGGKIATKALVARPEAAKKAGEAIAKRARRLGLFGSPLGISLALEPSR